MFHLPAEKIVSVWLYWWAGNVLGQLLVLPLILSWLGNPATDRDRKGLRHALIVVAVYFIPVIVFVFGDWGENGPLYRLLIFAAFYVPLIWVAVQSRVRTVALTNLLLTAPFLCLINAGPDLAIFFSNQNRHLCADIIIMAGIVTSLLISALWEQLNDRTNQLREANSAKERLFSVIGHDLNAPISSLKVSLDLLIDGTFTPEEFRDFQQDLRNGVNHAHQTLKNLMEWGNFQMASPKPRLESVSLWEAAVEASQLLALIAEEKNIAINNEIPKDALVSADM